MMSVVQDGSGGTSYTVSRLDVFPNPAAASVFALLQLLLDPTLEVAKDPTHQDR